MAGELDGERLKIGGLDVLAQHVLGSGLCRRAVRCRRASTAEIVSASPYQTPDGARISTSVVDFVATGGTTRSSAATATRACARRSEGKWRVSHPRIAQQYRMNVGVIVEDPMVDIRLQSKGRPVGAGGRSLGQLEEYFVEQLVQGDTFAFAGDVLRFEGIHEDAAYVTRTHDPEAQVPSYNGGKFPLSTFLAQRVREMVSKPESWDVLPEPVHEWLRIQEWRSIIPQCPGQLLVETFPRGSQAIISSATPVRGAPGALRRSACSDRGDWNALRMKRPLRLLRQRIRARGAGHCATWAGSTWASCSTRTCWATTSTRGSPKCAISTSAPSAIARSSPASSSGRYPGREKTGRQVTFSSDLIYDVLPRA